MKKPFYYGGQAVIEGVMMMGPKGYAVSARRPDGTIVTRKEQHHSVKERLTFLKWPVIRGFVNLIEMLILGMSTITWSANQSAEEEEELSAKEMVFSVVIALVAVIGLFLVLPTWLGTGLHPFIGDFGRSLFEGVLRIAVFLIYLAAIRRLDDILRVFQYHGAEHKTINAYEAGAELTPEAVKSYSTRHLRCGTSFVLMVMIVMIIVVLALVGVAIEQKAGYYECQKCGHRYVPTYSKTLFAQHMGRTRFMKCPKCGERSWQKKVLTNEEEKNE